MGSSGQLRIEAATGLSLGDRERQEDAVLCDMPQGGGAGIAVLADGLGGHVAGSLASRLAVATAAQHLAGHRTPEGRFDTPLPGLLGGAVAAANRAIAQCIGDRPEVAGMGTTLVAVVIEDGALYWASVGDSLLMLSRGGTLRQLNEVHSLARHLDLLARVGEITPEEAATHPGRSCLTSALSGQKVDRIDCPDVPIPLMAGDSVLLASDGVQTLSEAEMARVLERDDLEGIADRAAALLDAVAGAGAEGQDNTSVALLHARPAVAPCGARRTMFGRPFGLRRAAAAAAAAAIALPAAALRARRARAGTPARGDAAHEATGHG